MNQASAAPAYPSSVIIIFGITGDLSQRYLLPALAQMTIDRTIGQHTRVIGVTRRAVDADQLFIDFRDSVSKNRSTISEEAIEQLKGITSMFRMDLDDLSGYQELASQIDQLEQQNDNELAKLIYLSVPPTAYPGIISMIGKNKTELGFSTEKNGTKLLVEKPFGHDLISAKQLLELTNNSFRPDEIYRIDHFLAKQAVADYTNFLGNLRKERGEYWSSEFIDEIAIFASEMIDIQGRVKFYESLGALRDFVQNHLIQILAITGIDSSVEDTEAAKTNFLTSLNLAAPNPTGCSVRGQYSGYKDEVDNQSSITETYAQICLESGAANWKSTIFNVWSGKALQAKEYAITVKFKDGSKLTYRLQPNQQVIIEGSPESTAQKFSDIATDENSSLASRPLNLIDGSYQRVIQYAASSNQSIFAKAEDIIESWRIIDPIIKTWSKDDKGMLVYNKGAEGPLNKV